MQSALTQHDVQAASARLEVIFKPSHTPLRRADVDGQCVGGQASLMTSSSGGSCASAAHSQFRTSSCVFREGAWRSSLGVSRWKRVLSLSPLAHTNLVTARRLDAKERSSRSTTGDVSSRTPRPITGSADQTHLSKTELAAVCCPVVGYSLRPSGLLDEQASPPHTLTRAELRALIDDMAHIEQDGRCAEEEQRICARAIRPVRALERLVHPVLLLCGLYLMTWKTVKLYTGALPRRSLLLSRWLSCLYKGRYHRSITHGRGHCSPDCESVLWRTSCATGNNTVASGSNWRACIEEESRLSVQQEKLARRHRCVMQATNITVALTFVLGVVITTVALITRPAPDVITSAPEQQAAVDMTAFQAYLEHSLKWLWWVYFHHPVYKSNEEEDT